MIRSLALLLTVVTGFSGLVYEITWEKYLATLLGSHSAATASVLGLFLGGLALGYAIFGRVTRALLRRAHESGTPARLLLFYGAIEASIGVHALLFVPLFGALQGLSLLAPLGGGPLSFAFDVALSALLIGPPAVLMGGTIPILTQALARDLEDAPRLHARVYALNTAGAFLGALSAGFLLLPSLGLVRVVWLMAAVNLGAGACYALLGRRRATSPGAALAAQPSVRVRGAGLLIAIAGLCGFAMMTVQTALIRLGSLSLGTSQFTFSMVVAVFVLCIALGSFTVSALPRIPRWLLAASLWSLFCLLLLFYLQVEDGPYWGHMLRALFRDAPAAFYWHQLLVFLCLLLVVGPPIVLSGATLPLIFSDLRQQVGDLGAIAGRLYSVNTLGSLAGALLGGYALLYWLDLQQVFQLALGSLALAAALASARGLPRLALPWAGALAMLALIAVAWLPQWEILRLTSGLYRLRSPQAGSFEGANAFFAAYPVLPIRFHEDDPTATITVKEARLPDGTPNLTIVTNGKGDSSLLGEYVTTGLLGVVPAFLAGKTERAFVIGFGTGVTAGELAALSDMREVLVAEISPGVVQAAPLFEYGNLAATRSPKLKILQSDAYRALRRAEGEFDVIVSEPSNPWVTGIEMLYSREFLEAARSRLSPTGVHCQWIHSYETDDETLALVLRTYASVFEHVELWFGMSNDLLLLGLRDPEASLDMRRLEQRAARPDFAAAFRRTQVESLAGLLAHQILPVGVLHAMALRGELHSLLHPRLGYAAARSFFVGLDARLPVSAGIEAARIGAAHSGIRRLAELRGGALSDDERRRAVSEVCRYRATECAPLLGHWIWESPESPQLASLIAELRGRRDLDQALSVVSSMNALFDPSGASIPQGNPLVLARRASDVFERLFHPGAPFSRTALAQIWARCEGEPSLASACRESRAELEKRIGALDLQAGMDQSRF